MSLWFYIRTASLTVFDEGKICSYVAILGGKLVCKYVVTFSCCIQTDWTTSAQASRSDLHM